MWLDTKILDNLLRRLGERFTPHHRHEICRNVYKPADQRWMDELAIEDGGAVSVRREQVDQHDDLHLVVEREPPAFGIGLFWVGLKWEYITRQGRSL